MGQTIGTIAAAGTDPRRQHRSRLSRSGPKPPLTRPDRQPLPVGTTTSAFPAVVRIGTTDATA